ncbi:MAG: DUF3298 and DUF4163 domain-containing protein [Tissierellia bacterium]|nr:DUF3298 and DUF4163 domain-containing protein [Tissierellia bacterium]
MNGKELEKYKNEYLEIPVPEELEFIVKRSLKEGKKKMKKKSIMKRFNVAAASVAASIALITVGINSSPAFANTLSNVPGLGGIVQVLTFREYKVDEDTYNANIKTPSIQGLDNKELEASLNEKYLEENERLYKEFQEGMENMKNLGGGHLGVDSGYVIKTDNDKILSIGRYTVNTVASSSTVFEYDTIDKEKEILITLPSLFKDDSYIDLISENVKAQMIEQMEADENKIYWVQGRDDDSTVELFDEISKDQNFYITPDNKLVISFDKYEVAPGYMGVVEFTIPTDAISNILVSNEYVN